jgi:heme exporter protein A
MTLSGGKQVAESANTEIGLVAQRVKKVFNRRLVFQEVSFALSPKMVMLITGRNGSGKSTLAKIICNVLTPSAGKIVVTRSGNPVKDAHRALVGFMAPYLHMYEEFTPRENLRFALRARGMNADEDRIMVLLEKMNLGQRRNDPVREFSSGMKQRVKYAFALIHKPEILILDEPMANLDAEGEAIVREVMAEHATHGILIIATNDRRDIDRCDMEIDLNVRH